MIAVDLPWPSRVLHPNSRAHWGTRSSKTKKARADAVLAAKSAKFVKMSAPFVTATAIFTPPDGRRRDEDGMLSSIKPFIDGIADVIGIDDSRWSIAIRREPPKAPGNVRIEIVEREAA